ncbi:uncharacterized protein LOC122886867 [Siniperca chuatsi]|uniref:uncharacterized protein LOC122886867 n=1 Tax=Siniperca chuatsi TaxID=119488 RepID=UPI001CE07493|nr:uncharacterized protein LOC122886867 [Siniperca chuatsi]
MGKSQSKPKTREDLQCKDWKYIEKQDPDKIKYLDKWVKDYGFNGKLNVKTIKLLQETIQDNTNKDPKKMKKSGYEETKYWIKVAEKRNMNDVKKALEGITPYKEDVTQFVIDMENVRKSYHLNGQEVQQIWMCALGPDWHNVRGDWNPLNTAGDGPLPWDSQQMAVEVNGLATRATARFKQKANYTEIGRARQKDDETFDDYRHRMTTVFKIHSGLIDDNNDQGAYRQQLKNTLHVGSKDAIRSWVQRHYIGLSTGTLDEYINHALHAEKVAKEKKKKTVGPFFGEEETEEVFYHDQNRERGRNNRGRRFHRKGQREGRSRGGFGQRNRQREAGCWNCGKDGHFAVDCPENKQQA